MLCILAQNLSDPRASAWAPVLLLVAIAGAFVTGTIVFSRLIGPGRSGPGKQMTYESGMVPVGDARRRFNVRFYLVAMCFLVFDVEIVFFYPWAVAFPQAAWEGQPYAATLLVAMLIFVALLALAYAYEWGKGVFRWD